MSSIYEKSIADAKELRDIALKNAETIVLERYSEEVKKAVKTILEQDEDENGNEQLSVAVEVRSNLLKDMKVFKKYIRN